MQRIILKLCKYLIRRYCKDWHIHRNPQRKPKEEGIENGKDVNEKRT